MLYDIYFHFKKEEKKIENIDQKWRMLKYI